MSEYSPAVAASVTPLWLQIEAAYANAKYGNQNPQLTAPLGGLQSGGTAHTEFSQYLIRFDVFYAQAEGNETVLLHASQQLGKWVSTGRALLRVVLQDQYKLGTQEADTETFAIADEICLGLNRFPAVEDFKTKIYWSDRVEPHLLELSEAFQIRPLDVVPASLNLFSDQVALFAAITAKMGLIAEPGKTSGELDHWRLPTLN